MGTVNLFEALRDCSDLKAVLVITSDKVYENNNIGHLFKEGNNLGGSDPYSASKGCQEIITHSYRRSFFDDMGVQVATARAGNVIGGGDWSTDRLLKDVEAAICANQTVIIRNPLATRPWQHVLEPLAGYLMFTQQMVQGTALPNAINFGPHSSATVETVIDMYLHNRSSSAGWALDKGANPEEAHALAIDVSLAKDTLGWLPRLNLITTISWVADWFNAFANNQDMVSFSSEQIRVYETIIKTED
jgi:CDP-glucose 4,6-dehydratase